MSHETKSPSLGMISTATRTTATVSPLTPSPLNGSVVANGSPATQSTHSGFAAALRKLAKQAEEPRGKRNQYIWTFAAFANLKKLGHSNTHTLVPLKDHPTSQYCTHNWRFVWGSTFVFAMFCTVYISTNFVSIACAYTKERSTR